MSGLPDQPITIPIPLPGGQRWTSVTIPREMSSDEWEHWITVLQAMKPGIVPAEERA